MDRSSAVRELPVLHAVAIRLRDEGAGDHLIAAALDVEDDQVPILLRIADSKLRDLMDGSHRAPIAPITHVSSES